MFLYRKFIVLSGCLQKLIESCLIMKHVQSNNQEFIGTYSNWKCDCGWILTPMFRVTTLFSLIPWVIPSNTTQTSEKKYGAPRVQLLLWNTF